MDVIQSNRLIFREFSQDDIDNLFLLLNNPTVMKYCSGPLDLLGTQRWLDMIIESYKKYGYDYWAVYEKSTGDFIGQIGVLNQNIDNEQVNCLVYMIDPSHWNKGYATEGSIACLKYAFESLNLENLFATVEPENLPSISVLKKIGMKYAGEKNYYDNKVCAYMISKKNWHGIGQDC